MMLPLTSGYSNMWEQPPSGSTLRQHNLIQQAAFAQAFNNQQQYFEE